MNHHITKHSDYKQYDDQGGGIIFTLQGGLDQSPFTSQVFEYYSKKTSLYIVFDVFEQFAVSLIIKEKLLYSLSLTLST